MSKQLKTGIAAVLIIAIFIWGFNFLKGKNLLDPNSRFFKVEYSNIAGLSKSSLVTINGLKVGKIDEIEFNTDVTKKGQLIVRFSIDTDFQFSKNSIVKIYSPSPLGGSNLAIVPYYDEETAISGDTLKGEVESSLFTSIGERLDPIQNKLEHVMISADSLFKNLNDILDKQTRKSIKRSLSNLEYTILDVRKMIKSSKTILDSSAVGFQETLKNTKKITENFAKVSDTLVNSNIGGVLKKTELTLNTVNALLKGIEEGKGSMGKFINDDAMYINLTNVSKEMEELLREMKLNPKRFVHFSLFGKRAKPYISETDSKK
jgi:phospholipid/cholesterol/gamma-HCH transport system substrate-binding protein